MCPYSEIVGDFDKYFTAELLPTQTSACLRLSYVKAKSIKEPLGNFYIWMVSSKSSKLGFEDFNERLHINPSIIKKMEICDLFENEI